MPGDDARLLDILFAAEDIAQFISGKRVQDYETDNLVRAAVERKIYVIGEAARALSTEFKAKHPSIPWAKIIGTRNILAHEYGQVNDHIIWETASKHVPALAEYLKPFSPPEVEE